MRQVFYLAAASLFIASSAAQVAPFPPPMLPMPVASIARWLERDR
jgi:hypothetical protein